MTLVETEETRLVAELRTDVALEAPLLVREASSDDKELALEPVAVASSELMEDSRLAISELTDERADDTSLLAETEALDTTELAEDKRLEMLLASTEEEDDMDSED